MGAGSSELLLWRLILGWSRGGPGVRLAGGLRLGWEGVELGASMAVDLMDFVVGPGYMTPVKLNCPDSLIPAGVKSE